MTVTTQPKSAISPTLALSAHGLAMFADPLPIPPVRRAVPNRRGVARLAVTLQTAWGRLHSALPTTRMWTYEGSFPGPTIEVRRGTRLRVQWRNELTGPFPVVAVTGAPALSENEPGRSGRDPLPGVASLRPWTVAHLHGGRTAGSSDGWTENAALHGETITTEYANDQRATLLWYHDHAMGITRLNVMAGLAGLYVIRDHEEKQLGLPGGKYEIPLLIADRNLDTDSDGSLTGRLLHKTEDGTGEFFAPFPTVNGRIWPYLDVKPRPYRFRVINGSNARVYRLLLLDESGAVRHEPIAQIGTDGGLLGAPVPLPDGGLLLAPAERADLVIDFSAPTLAGHTLTLVNTAAAPFHNDPAPSGWQPPAPDPDPEHRLPYPQVMQFRVAPRTSSKPPAKPVPTQLAGSYSRIDHDAIPQHVHRLVCLVERDQGDGTTMLELWEMDDGTPNPPAGDAPEGAVDITDAKGVTIRHHRLASRFLDTVNWVVQLDGWEIWRILNLTGDTHPFHVHLVQFQALRREAYNTDGFDPDLGHTTTPVAFDPGTVLALDPNETGDKDVIRVNPNEQATIAAQFSGGTGRYMYHCHILEHEDHEMMRPFVVMPSDAMAAGMGSGPTSMPMPMPMPVPMPR